MVSARFEKPFCVAASADVLPAGVKTVDLWFGLKDNSKYLYHYTRSSTLVGLILPWHRLRFAPFSGVNDPREAKEKIFQTYHRLPGSEPFLDKACSDVNAAIQSRSFVGCFVRDPEDALCTGERELQGHDVVEAASYRGLARQRMWAQYGENYHGACLIFDRSRLRHKVRMAARQVRARFFEGPVSYEFHQFTVPAHRAFTVDVDRYCHDALRYVNTHIPTFHHELFYKKDPEWAQEYEFRFVVFARQALSEVYVDITRCIVGILLGDRFPVCCREYVYEYARANGVSTAVMDWHNGYPQPKPILRRP